MASLDQEQKQLLKEQLVHSLPDEHDVTWAALGKKLAASALTACTRRFKWPAELLAFALRDVGLTDRRDVLRKVKLDVSKNVWKASHPEHRKHDVPEYAHVKYDNGLLGYRRCSQEEIEVLQDKAQHSSKTCGRGRGIQLAPDEEPNFERNLLDARGQVWAQSTLPIGLSTWYRN